MSGARRLGVALLLVVSLAAAACGGSAETAGDPGGPDQPTSPTTTDRRAGPGNDADEPETTAIEPPAAPVATTASTSTSAPAEPARAEIVCGEDPDPLGFDPFYDQYCDAGGIPVLASAAVDPEAVRITAEIMVAMIGHRPDVIEAIAGSEVRMAVMAGTEVTTDLPEYRDLYQQFPGTDWDTRTRGLGATAFIPLSSAAEENVLCRDDDVYRGESILVHEFAHTVQIMGLDVIDPTFPSRLGAIYDRSMAAGLWANTYAATNAEEYFAEAVQSWFDTNQVGPPGGDGIHNDIDTRAELTAYDPEISDLIAEVFLPTSLPLCQGV